MKRSTKTALLIVAIHLTISLSVLLGLHQFSGLVTPGDLPLWGIAAAGLIAGLVLFLCTAAILRWCERTTRSNLEEGENLKYLVEGVSASPLFLVDDTGAVTTWNPAAERLTGWSREEVTGKPFAQFLPADAATPEPIESMLAKARREGGFASELRRIRKDGTSYWARLLVEPVENPAGRLLGFACSARDISERKQAESFLAESERLFRAIFEEAPIGIAQVARDGRMLRVNPHFCMLVGRTEQELQKLTFADFTHPADRDPDIQFVTRCLAGEIDRFSLEKRYVRPDGRIVWANLFVSLVNDARGNPAYFVSVVNDITWKRAAEEALAESRHRLESAIEIAQLGFWEYNVATRSIFYSREAKSQLGYGEEEVAQDPDEYRSRVHPDDRDRLESMRSSVLSGTAESAEGEFRFRHKDGTYRDIFVRTIMLRDRDRRPVRLLGTNIDLTRTRDIERLVRRLSARILHLQDEERRRIARQLHDTTAQNLAALNMNLARIARLTAGNCTFAETLEDSVALTDLCVQEIRTLAYLLHPPLLDTFGLERATQDYVKGFSERSGIEIATDIVGPVGRLSDDVELSIFRVLQESLGNVARHAECTEASVKLSRQDDTVMLEVRDSGKGIPPEILASLRSGAPLGVGVTGMSERLEQIGGRLDIQSDSSGTSVRATVPVRETED